MSLLQFIKNRISAEKKIKLKYRLRSVKGFFYSYNLNKLARLHRTDKFGYHYYTPHYQKHFRPFKFRRINLLEIGVGGYDHFTGGNSLRMWKSYFPFARIFSIDIHDKSHLEENRIKIYKGSQVDLGFLETVCNETGNFDLIVDDGSHINAHVIKSFEFLFPKLNRGGIYVIEDTQTSYWPEMGGSSKDFNLKGTIYHYFKTLIDSLNCEEFELPGYQKTYYDKHIVSMHFYHNLIFIYKGDNNEPSNKLRNNRFR